MFELEGDVHARTEQVLDDNNNNLMISMQAPDDWNSGKLSMTALNLDWKLNGLFATNFATKLFGSSEESIAFFAVINAPSIANAALPIVQKLGLISFALSQVVTVNRESDLKLSDGSPAHLYSISASLEQLQKFKAPIDKPLDAVLIITQQNDKTYFVVYGTELGKMGQYQSNFNNMLNSVTIGSTSFSNVGSPAGQSSAEQQLNEQQPSVEPDLGAPPSDTQQTTVQTPPEPVKISGPKVYVDRTCGPASPGFNVVINANGFKPNSNVNWKLIDSHNGIPLYGYFKTNSTGGFNDVTFMDDLQQDNYKLAFGNDDNNDNKFDAGSSIQFVNIEIPCP